MFKNNAFLTIMLGVLSSIFHTNRAYGMADPFQPKAPMPTGEVHIKSYGHKPVYGKLPRKRFYQEIATQRAWANRVKLQVLDARGLLRHDGKLYWKTRELAEANN